MTITVCIGSSCHLKGAREVVEQLQNQVEKRGLQDRVKLTGAFCMGNCVAGVSVRIGEEIFSVKPDTALNFFENEVMTRL